MAEPTGAENESFKNTDALAKKIEHNPDKATNQERQEALEKDAATIRDRLPTEARARFDAEFKEWKNRHLNATADFEMGKLERKQEIMTEHRHLLAKLKGQAEYLRNEVQKESKEQRLKKSFDDMLKLATPSDDGIPDYENDRFYAREGGNETLRGGEAFERTVGFMMATQMGGGARSGEYVQKQFARFKDAYEKNYGDDWLPGSQLSAEEARLMMNFDAYKNKLEDYKLTYLDQGYVLGLINTADELVKDGQISQMEADRYKQNVWATLERNKEKLPHRNWDYGSYDRDPKEISILNLFETPLEETEKLQQQVKDFQKVARKLQENYKIEWKGNVARVMNDLKKIKEVKTGLNIEKLLEDAKKDAAHEVMDALNKKVKEFWTDGGLVGEAGKLEQRLKDFEKPDSKLKPEQEAALEEAKRAFDDFIDALESLKVKPGDEKADLETFAERPSFDEINQAFQTFKDKVDAIGPEPTQAKKEKTSPVPENSAEQKKSAEAQAKASNAPANGTKGEPLPPLPASGPTEDRGQAPEKSSDIYEQNWAYERGARDVVSDLDDYRGVLRTTATTNVREAATGHIVRQVPAGTFVVPGEGPAREVEGQNGQSEIFVPVEFDDEDGGGRERVMVARSLLEKVDRNGQPLGSNSGLDQPEANTPWSRLHALRTEKQNDMVQRYRSAEDPTEHSEWSRPVRLNMTRIFDLIDQKGDTPDGVTFDLPFNGKFLDCRVQSDKEGHYILTYNGGKLRYGNKQALFTALNFGGIEKEIMWKSLRTDFVTYKRFEKIMGEIEDLEIKDKDAHQVSFKLDWPGRDPEVTLEVKDFGFIGFKIERKNIGVNGENVRSGVAHDMADLAVQLQHYREWSRQPQHETVVNGETRAELAFDTITNPLNYTQNRLRIGELLSFKIQPNEVVKMELDFGPDKGRTLVNVWVNNGDAREKGKKGDIVFIVNGPSAKVGPQAVENFSDLMSQLDRIAGLPHLQVNQAPEDRGAPPASNEGAPDENQDPATDNDPDQKKI